MKYVPLVVCGVIGNVICVGYVTSLHVWKGVTSQNLQTARAHDLEVLAQHIKSDSCWFNKSKTPFKITDVVEVSGSQNGLIPTSCIYAIKTKQYLKVDYLNGQLKVSQVFSPKEIQNQLSIQGK